MTIQFFRFAAMFLLFASFCVKTIEEKGTTEHTIKVPSLIEGNNPKVPSHCNDKFLRETFAKNLLM